jgi:Ni,Fe-hydrogenase III small subunit
VTLASRVSVTGTPQHARVLLVAGAVAGPIRVTF